MDLKRIFLGSLLSEWIDRLQQVEENGKLIVWERKRKIKESVSSAANWKTTD